MSYRRIYYHIVITTKYRKKTLPLEHHKELYKYIWGITKNKNCKLYQINGYLEHLHLLTDLNPTIALADFVRDIKAYSSKWLKENPKFPKFIGWTKGYGAFTISHFDKEKIIRYIKRQKEHHSKNKFKTEYMQFLKKHDIDFEEKHLWT